MKYSPLRASGLQPNCCSRLIRSPPESVYFLLPPAPLPRYRQAPVTESPPLQTVPRYRRPRCFRRVPLVMQTKLSKSVGEKELSWSGGEEELSRSGGVAPSISCSALSGSWQCSNCPAPSLTSRCVSARPMMTTVIIALS